MTAIRPETAADHAAIERVNTLAFGRELEARIVSGVRGTEAFVPELSLVLEQDGEIVAHVLLSRVQIEGNAAVTAVLGLGPVAVLPERQRQGFGSRLIRAGLERAAALGFAGVILLGHPTYYPRFGFQPASGYGMRLPFSVADEAFMARPLRPGGLDDVAGVVLFSEPFRDAE